MCITTQDPMLPESCAVNVAVMWKKKGGCQVYPPDSRAIAYFFSTLLLPRMVASGLAACFMNADGLMPTMFLNCLEK